MTHNIGTQEDPAVTDPTLAATVTAALKGLLSLMASGIAITEPVSVDDNGGSLTVDGPLTDAQIRATALPVSGPLTDTELRASDIPVSSTPFAAMLELGITELIGIDEQVDQNEWGGSVQLTLGSARSGEIIAAMLCTTEDGTGAIRKPAGHLVLFDANPAITAGDPTLGTARWPTILSIIDIATGDWISDSTGAAAYKCNLGIPFHSLSSLYACWLHTDLNSFNDAGADDEQLELNLWYRRDS